MVVMHPVVARAHAHAKSRTVVVSIDDTFSKREKEAKPILAVTDCRYCLLGSSGARMKNST